MNILLQITETPSVVTEASQEMSIASLLYQGGVVMIPILILSLITVYVFIERYLYIRSVTKGKKDLMVHVKNRLQQGDIKGARLYAEQEDSATGRIILSGLEQVGKPVKDIEAMMESCANIEVAEMEKNTGYLGIIASIAPMVGFIGTISGVIRIFYNISLSDNISIGAISGGLYEKMITSGAGLIVGVIAYSAYHYLHLKIQKFTLQVQKDAFEFMRSILSPAS